MTREHGIAVVQMEWRPAGPPARERATMAAESAFEAGADIVVLPELAVPGYTTDPKILKRYAEPVDGPTTQLWCKLATAHRGLVIGGFCERAGDSLFNTAVVVDGSGVILHYRKAHLFGEERSALSNGDTGFPVVATATAGTIGVCVCYDLRFVEVVRLLALQGADLICVPTAWVTGYDAVADLGLVPQQVTGLLVQANLSQVFIAAASVAGAGPEHRFLGSSVIADPYGQLVGGPLSRDSSGIALASIDLSVAEAARHRSSLVHPRAERRRDLYGLSYQDAEY